MPIETEWQVGRLETRGQGGMVAAKTALAAKAGADVLRLGGNAVDAAVTVDEELCGLFESRRNGESAVP